MKNLNELNRDQNENIDFEKRKKQLTALLLTQRLSSDDKRLLLEKIKLLQQKNEKIEELKKNQIALEQSWLKLKKKFNF